MFRSLKFPTTYLSATLCAVMVVGLTALILDAQTIPEYSQSTSAPEQILAVEPNDLNQWVDHQIWSNAQPQATQEPGSQFNSQSDFQFSQQSNVSPNAYLDQSSSVPISGFAPIQSDIETAVQGSQEDLGLATSVVPPPPAPSFFGKLWQDELHFYSPKSLTMIGGGLLVGAAFANSNWDRGIQEHVQSSLHHANTDEWLEGLHANKEMGDGRYTLPVFAGAWAVGKLLPDNFYAQNLGNWGDRSIRGIVVGAPAVLVLQKFTGGSRPGETIHGSGWEPLQDNNGVSGHAFMGSLPFITAAKMTESRGLKTVFYAASALTPLSRTADGAHYPSQVMLGWWMAYVAASAVQATDRENSNWRIIPTATPTSTGMAFEYRY